MNITQNPWTEFSTQKHEKLEKKQKPPPLFHCERRLESRCISDYISPSDKRWKQCQGKKECRRFKHRSLISVMKKYAAEGVCVCVYIFKILMHVFKVL